MRTARTAAQDFFERIADWYHRQPEGFNGRVRKPIGCPETFRKKLRKVGTAIATGASQIKDETQRIELDAAEKRCRSLAGEISAWLRQTTPERLLGRVENVPAPSAAGLGPAGCGPDSAKAAVRHGPDLRADLGHALRRLAAQVRFHQVAAGLEGPRTLPRQPV